MSSLIDRTLTYYQRLHSSRTTNTRILTSIIFCAIVWICLAAKGILPAPRIVFDNHDQPHPLQPLPPTAALNAHDNKIQASSKATKLSQTFFPVSDPEKTDSWIGENHKMLQALFRCMELSNCRRNQNKGVFCVLIQLVLCLPLSVVLLSSYHFRGAFWGWVGGEDVW